MEGGGGGGEGNDGKGREGKAISFLPVTPRSLSALAPSIPHSRFSLDRSSPAPRVKSPFSH